MKMYSVIQRDVGFFFLQLVAGIEHAHKKLVVHRDIKPENVLVDLEGNLKICDFGLSAMLVREKCVAVCGKCVAVCEMCCSVW